MTDFYERIGQLRAEGLRWTEIAKRLSEEFGRPFSDDGVRNAHTRWIARGKQPPKPGKGAIEEPPKAKEPELPTVEERIADEARLLREKNDADTMKRLLRDRAGEELFAEVLREAASRLRFPPLTINPPTQPKGDFPEEEAVIVLSDMHIGSDVDEEETGGLGGYNLAVFQERLQTLEDAVREILAIHRRAYPIRRLRVFGIGDWIDGQSIFKGHAHHIQVDITEQMLIAVHSIGEMLIRLLDSVDEIKVLILGGNHGRFGMKGEAKDHTNMDRVVGMWMRDLTQNHPRITYRIPKSWWAIEEVLGWRFLCTHGEDIKSWNSIPYYGIDRADARYTKLMGANEMPYHYFVVGHFHNAADIDAVGGEKIVNGAWPGASPFSLKVLQTASRPSQMFFGVSPKKGITWRYRLYLDEDARHRAG